jgi:hypothetical protein
VKSGEAYPSYNAVVAAPAATFPHARAWHCALRHTASGRAYWPRAPFFGAPSSTIACVVASVCPPITPKSRAAKQEAAARSSTEKQMLEDADHLIAVWNERQAKRMPMLFSPTIGAAIGG